MSIGNAAELLFEDDSLRQTTQVDPLQEIPDHETTLQDPIDDTCEIHGGMLWLPTPDGKKTLVRVDPSAVIGKDVQVGKNRGPIGRNSTVGEGSLILGALYNNIELGKNVAIGGEARIGSVGAAVAQGKIIIEDAVNIGGRCRIHSPAQEEKTRIGSETHIGSRVRIGEPNSKRVSLAPVEIGTRALIGDGVVIRPGVRIGEGAEIAAGYTIVEGTEIPAGIRIRFQPARPSRKPTIGQHWQKELKSYIDFID